MNFIKDAKNHWTVVIDNKTYRFDSTHKDYIALVECVSSGNDQTLIEILSVGLRVENWSNGNFQFKDGVLYYGQEIIHNTITDRVVDHLKQGIPCNYILKFLENLYKNPSYRAITELYKFLEHKSLPITPDGCFLAYKAVHVHSGGNIVDLEGRTIKAGDCVDKWTTKRYRNNVGDNPTMPRHQVDDNCQSHCSNGLHAGTISYATGYANSSDKIMIVKIDPMNVVSIPTDCDCQKLRNCSYIVVGEYERDLDDSFSNEFDGVEDPIEDDDTDFCEFDDDDFDDDDDDDDCHDPDCPICAALEQEEEEDEEDYDDSREAEYTEQDSDDADAALAITGDFGVSDGVVIDARNQHPPIPEGWELFVPVINDKYPDCRFWRHDMDFEWQNPYLLGVEVSVPMNDTTLYIKESK